MTGCGDSPVQETGLCSHHNQVDPRVFWVGEVPVMRRLVVCMMAVLALTACQDRGPTGPDGQLQPAFTHQTLHQGPGFYFISPVPPGSQQVPGVFDDTLSPSVEIWKLSGQNGAVVGASPVASLTATAISQHYQVSWSGLQALDRGYYRIEVRSAPSNQTHLFYGSVEVELVDGGG